MTTDLPAPATPDHPREPTTPELRQAVPPAAPTPRDEGPLGAWAGIVEYESWLRRLG